MKRITGFWNWSKIRDFYLFINDEFYWYIVNNKTKIVEFKFERFLNLNLLEKNK